MPIARDDLVKALRTVRDPEIPVNIWDLGLIYALEISESAVMVRMTLTAPNCPMADTIVRDVERRLSEVEGVAGVEVEIVWEPQWEPSMMSEAARLELEYTGHTGPAHLRRDPFSKLTIDRQSARRAPRSPSRGEGRDG